jgi:7-cyano-7-deazaguanine synthase in queuosine biosynthesis
MNAAKATGYAVTFSGNNGQEERVMIEGQDFHVTESRLSAGLVSSLSTRQRDLIRIASGVYFADRLIRRKKGARVVKLAVEVGDFDFWRSPDVRTLVENAVQTVSDDVWDLVLKPGLTARVDPYLPFPYEVERVCLYSGGLDSAAGLASRLRADATPMLTLTACHQAGQGKRVREQVTAMSRHYGVKAFSLLPRVALVKPPRLSLQEVSQRCRAFLFLALGGAVACRAGAAAVEIYENGVGVLNLPFMTGMLFGSRTTKGTHPLFLRLMSDLLTRLSERQLNFVLPFVDCTKAELVKTLAQENLATVARATVSCAHYPIRTGGGVQQCGWCPGCIGRRQALIDAGITEDSNAYQYDLFGSALLTNAVPAPKLDFIKAHLMQLAQLEKLQDDGRKPDILWRHVTWTKFLAEQESILPWVSLLRRYREEWRTLLDRGRTVGWRWATLFSTSGEAA